MLPDRAAEQVVQHLAATLTLLVAQVLRLLAEPHQAAELFRARWGLQATLRAVVVQVTQLRQAEATALQDASALRTPNMTLPNILKHWPVILTAAMCIMGFSTMQADVQHHAEQIKSLESDHDVLTRVDERQKTMSEDIKTMKDDIKDIAKAVK